jgi:hypothetical protein
MSDAALKSLYLPKAVHLLLWIVLLLLTSAISLFPVTLNFEYHAVESLHIFGDYLWFFGILFVLWMAILLLLLLTGIGEWQRIALLAIFAFVFFGFWVFITPYGGWCDGLVNMGNVRYLSQSESIPFDHITLAYFQYPGIHLTGFALSEILGIDIPEIRTFFLVFCRVLLAILLYLLFARSIKNPQMASLAVIFLACGAMLITRTVFHAGVTAIIFFVIMLYFLVKSGALAKPAIASLFILCFAALTITYVPIPVFFIFVLGGIYLINRFSKQKTVNLTLLILCAVVFLIWQIFWATLMFEGLAEHTEDFLAAFEDPLERLMPLFGIATQKLGEQIPLWARLTSYFWLVFLYLFGGVLAIRNIFKIKKLDSIGTIETGGLWGIIIASAITIFAFSEGTQYHRFLMYVPFLAAPLIIKFVSGIEKNKRELQFIDTPLSQNPVGANKFSLIAIPLLLLVLSFPTFLVNHSGINTQSVYEYELSSGEFVRDYFEQDGLLFISDVVTVYSFMYYTPDAELSPPPQLWDISNEEELWLSFQRKADTFINYRKTSVFAVSERFDQPYRSTYDIDKTGTKWAAFISQLAPSDMVYDNGHTQIFVNKP